MLNNIVKTTQNNQLPIKVAANLVPVTELLNEFYQLGGKDTHNELIKELCLAFTGTDRGSKANTTKISEFVFRVNFFKKVLNNLQLASISGNSNSLLECLPNIDFKSTIEVIDDSLTNWIDLPENDPWCDEYLQVGLTTFHTLRSLINRLSALSLIYANQLKGGVSC